jgi:hypothetical protein
MHRWIPTARCAMTALAAAAPRVRRVVPLALALALVAGVTQPAVRGATTMDWGDYDRDGIDDGVEQWAAEYFMPNMRYHADEDCTGPGFNPVLFRVRQLRLRNVLYPEWAAIHYVRLYEQDCGSPNSAGGLGRHTNDNEPFTVIVRLFEGEWRTAELVAFNHGNTWFETHTNRSYSPPLRPWQGRPDLFISLWKHANYADPSRCHFGPPIHYWPDICSSFGPSLAHTLRNVGEPRSSLMPDLGEAFPQPNNFGVTGWYGHDPWGNQELPGAGLIRDGLTMRNFVYKSRADVVDPGRTMSVVHQCRDELHSQEWVRNKWGNNDLEDAYVHELDNCNNLQYFARWDE